MSKISEIKEIDNQEINELLIGCKIANIVINDYTLETILLIYENSKLTELSLKDVIKIQTLIENKYQLTENNFLPDKSFVNKRLVIGLENYFHKKYEEILIVDIQNTSVTDFSKGRRVGYITLKYYESLKNYLQYGIGNIKILQ